MWAKTLVDVPYPRKGDRPKNWRGTQVLDRFLVTFFNPDGALKFLHVGHILVFEVAGWTSSGFPTWCWRSLFLPALIRWYTSAHFQMAESEDVGHITVCFSRSTSVGTIGASLPAL